MMGNLENSISDTVFTSSTSTAGRKPAGEEDRGVREK